MFPVSDSVQRTRPPLLVGAIIAVNVVAFLYQLTMSQPEAAAFLKEYALVPRRYVDWTWARQNGLSPANPLPFVTSMFLHGGVLHILLNMWTLYIFGPALEDRLGPMRFLILYVAAGLGAGALHALFNLFSAIPTLGASGAIAGLIAAYAVRFPYAWVNVVVPVIFIPVFFTVPATVFAGLWFMLQVLQGTTALLQPAQGGGVAWWAHIGGFAAGWFLLRRLDRGRKLHMPPRPPNSGSHGAATEILWPFSLWWQWATWWWPRRGG